MIKNVSFVMVTLAASVGIAAGQGAAEKAKAPTPTAVKAPESKPAPPAAPEMPKPPAEIAAFAKQAAGSWKCKGTTADMTNPTATIAMTATVKTKSDLDGWWLSDSMTGKAGKTTFKMSAYTTYDAKSAKWRRVSVDNGGTQMVGTSDGMKDGKMTFNMDTMGPWGGGMFRDYTDMSDMKAGAKMWGEMSMDKGKTWSKVYDMTCKK
jgi:hypothetical protein